MSGQRPLFDPDRMRGPEKTRPTERLMTVSQLNAYVRLVLSEELPSSLHVVGEISNLSRAPSGHLYLTLKDARAEVRCIMWRSAATNLKFEPTDGLKVVATGHVDIFESRGQYQFYIRRLEPRGTGALELAFQQLKERLEREGLFETARKKPIPRYPRHIGVVTSPTGAAVRDIIKTLHRRYPGVQVTLLPVRVQGTGAGKEIAGAVRQLNEVAQRLGGIDVLIVGRGGGSLEDLWAFNEECVARAIAASPIPVISAVGHEVDVTIADLAADLRAPTPTAGAELAVPVLDEVLDQLVDRAARLRRTVRHRLEMGRSRLDALARAPWLRNPMVLVTNAASALDERAGRLPLVARHRIERARARLAALERRLADRHPHRLVSRHAQRLATLAVRLHSRTATRLATARNELHATEIRWARAHPRHRLQHERQQLEHLGAMLSRTLRAQLASAHRRVDHVEARLQAGSYHRTLARGFSITRRSDEGIIIRAASEVQTGQHVITETADGTFTSEIVDPGGNT